MSASPSVNAYEEMLRADRAELEVQVLRARLARILTMADAWEQSFVTIDATVAVEALRATIRPDH